MSDEEPSFETSRLCLFQCTSQCNPVHSLYTSKVILLPLFNEVIREVTCRKSFEEL